MEVFIFLVSLIAGFILGCILGLALFKERNNNEPVYDRKAGRKPPAETEKVEPVEKSVNEKPLKKTLSDKLKKGESWTDIECENDPDATKAHIGKSIKKQDSAYRYAKKKGA